MKLRHFLPAAALLAVAAFSSCSSGNPSKQEQENIEKVNEADMTPDKPFTGVHEVVDDNIPSTPGVAQFIDFNATWCGPCQNFAPVFHKVAEEFAGKANFYSVDTDVNPDLAELYNVQSIPMIVGISQDGQVTTTIGAKSYDEFVAFVNDVIK